MARAPNNHQVVLFTTNLQLILRCAMYVDKRTDGDSTNRKHKKNCWFVDATFKQLQTLLMKTASLGLLEVIDGGTCECRGGCPPGPPSVGDVMGPFPFLCFLQLQEQFLANER